MANELIKTSPEGQLLIYEDVTLIRKFRIVQTEGIRQVKEIS